MLVVCVPLWQLATPMYTYIACQASILNASHIEWASIMLLLLSLAVGLPALPWS